MQPKIFFSGNQEERDLLIWQTLEKFEIEPSNPDILVLEDEKIGIAQIKQLIRHLSTKPFGKTPKSAVILNANNISPDAQNALLKILEEPPGESVILIGVDSETKLLPTVLSRCLVVSHGELDLTYHLGGVKLNLQELIEASIEERFEIIEKTNDKEKFLEDLIQSYRKKLQNSDANSYHTSEVGFLEELLQAQIWKESNVNIRTI